MSKNIKELLVLLVLVSIGIVYAINQYLMVPARSAVEQHERQLQADKVRLNALQTDNDSIEVLKKQNAKLKQAAEELDSLIVKDINTPQLVYELYNSCKEYNVTGKDLTFQLEAQDSGAASNTQKNEQTSQSTENNQQTSQSVQNTQQQNSNYENLVTKLSITLKIEGDKNSVEDFVRHLDTLTSRKLTVQDIVLEAADTNENTGANTSQNNIPTDGTMPQTNDTTIPDDNADKLAASITFNQYISINEASQEARKYNFYNGKSGFENFADMFK